LSPQDSELPCYSKSFIRSRIKDEDLTSIKKKFEEKFNSYMMILNVDAPNTTTYTSKCIQEIIGFIEQIIKMDFAYKYNSCIYFDVLKFVGQYPLSQSWLDGLAAVSAACEGTETLVTPITTTTKKSQWDFILWQQAAENELTFIAPWGAGKPGWDIECSVIATTVLRKNLFSV